MEKITKYQLFTLLAFSLIFLSFYFCIENYNLDRENYYHPMLSFENSIPKISFFVIFYLLAYPLGILPFILIKEKELLKKTLKAYLIIITISTIIYLIFPTEIIKPDLNLNNFFDRIIFSFRIISPHNILPSLHASLMLLSTLICNIKYKKLGKFLYIFTIFVGLSTLFTKQHYILDVITSFLLAFIAFKLVFKKTYK